MNGGGINATVGGRSLWQNAGERLRRNKAAMFSLWLLLVFVVLVVAGPWLAQHDYTQTNLSLGSTAPSLAGGHWFGTDALGRDVLARTLAGGRISLLVGLVATLVSLLIGVFWGAVAGYCGGRVDALMMRFVDLLYAMPFMFFVILLMVVFGRNILLIFVAIGAINWLDMARIVRGQTISLRHREFIQAATLMGAGTLTIIVRHVIPNLLGVVVVYVTLTIPQVMLVESFLSYLGLGVQEPFTSWGALVNQGALEMETAPWLLVFPALFLAGTLFCFNFIGDGLRDALDVKSDEDGW
ncbi:MAG: ABC transporter permease subunit [Proteobacteria bacterium]|nr:ABC transporter permease subunit [Pseudomonadota bacterium]